MLTADGHTLSARTSHQDLHNLGGGSPGAQGGGLRGSSGPQVQPFNMWGHQEVCVCVCTRVCMLVSVGGECAV